MREVRSRSYEIADEVWGNLSDGMSKLGVSHRVFGTVLHHVSVIEISMSIEQMHAITKRQVRDVFQGR